MAKTYLSAVKYNIMAEFQINGIVDKPDIIGAIFGQSEGLLGHEMDLKQLQQNGKIGRIEIDSKVINGQTIGNIVIPSSMDMAQTSLLAAAIEAVDKVGPCESKIQTKKIEDTRGEKRKVISNRAQELLKQFMQNEIPESQEMATELMTSVKTAKLVPFGADKLPAGPEVADSNEIIVVEGRADVLNLLKCNIGNAIAMEGSNVPPTLIELAKRKTVIAFVDGDRGGELNARKLQEVAKLDYVVKAPDGKEVEELTQKEIIMALRKRITPEEAFQRKPITLFENNHRGNGFERKSYGRENRFDNRNDRRDNRTSGFGRNEGRGRFDPRNRGSGMRSMRMERGNNRFPRNGPRFPSSNNPSDQMPGMTESAFEKPVPKETGFGLGNGGLRMPENTTPNTEEKQVFEPVMKELNGTLKAKLLDDKNQTLGESKVRDLMQTLKKTKNVHTVVFDGIITKRLAEEAETLGVQRLVGIKKGWFKPDGKIKLLTIQN